MTTTNEVEVTVKGASQADASAEVINETVTAETVADEDDDDDEVKPSRAVAKVDPNALEIDHLAVTEIQEQYTVISRNGKDELVKEEVPIVLGAAMHMKTTGINRILTIQKGEERTMAIGAMMAHAQKICGVKAIMGRRLPKVAILFDGIEFGLPEFPLKKDNETPQQYMSNNQFKLNGIVDKLEKDIVNYVSGVKAFDATNFGKSNLQIAEEKREAEAAAAHADVNP